MITLVAACYDDLTAAIVAERDRHAEQAVGIRMLECARAFRRWAVAHTPEFNLLFGTPIPDLDQPPDGPSEEAGRRFGSVFGALFVELWATAPFLVPAEADIEPSLAAGLAECREKMGLGDLPMGAVLAYMSSWVKLYGSVTMEVFGHLKFATNDGEPLFELTVREIAAVLGIEPSS